MFDFRTGCDLTLEKLVKVNILILFFESVSLGSRSYDLLTLRLRQDLRSLTLAHRLVVPELLATQLFASLRNR